MRRGPAATAVYAVLLALVVTGCGHSSVPTADDVRVPAGRGAERPTPLSAVQAPLPLSPTEEVARVGLRSGEIPSAQRVRRPTVRLDAPVLARCGAGPGGHLVARRTVTAAAPHSPLRYTDRTLVYDSVASARPALAAVRRVVAACATAAPRRVATALPVTRAYAAELGVRGRAGDLHVLVVAQQRGDVLDVLTVTSPRPLTVGQQRLLLREAADTGSRLARLPLASAGA
jgi:hypothetical protein